MKTLLNEKENLALKTVISNIFKELNVASASMLPEEICVAPLPKNIVESDIVDDSKISSKLTVLNEGNEFVITHISDKGVVLKTWIIFKLDGELKVTILLVTGKDLPEVTNLIAGLNKTLNVDLVTLTPDEVALELTRKRQVVYKCINVDGKKSTIKLNYLGWVISVVKLDSADHITDHLEITKIDDKFALAPSERFDSSKYLIGKNTYVPKPTPTNRVNDLRVELSNKVSSMVGNVTEDNYRELIDLFKRYQIELSANPTQLELDAYRVIKDVVDTVTIELNYIRQRKASMINK